MHAIMHHCAIMMHETAPELYPQMVELGTVTSLLGLLTHENTDISISAITVLQDLTDADVILEREEVRVCA
jgi:beta-catenin-like protein 1